MGSPFWSVTLAYTSTTLTPDENCEPVDESPSATSRPPSDLKPGVDSRALGCAVRAGTRAPATARPMVIELTSLQPHSQGDVMGLGLGIPELIVILFLIILIFGASRLPEIGRGIGKGIRNFKEATREGANRDDR